MIRRHRFTATAVRMTLFGMLAAIALSPVGGVAAASLQDDSGQPMNILLMGSDARPGEEIDRGVRPDLLAVLHLDPADGSCRLLSIPRDTRVDIPGTGQTKINHALMLGGIDLQREVVANYLGIDLDKYALIDMAGAEQLIDAIGGVTVPIPETFTFGPYTYVAGNTTLTGPEAVFYSRYRGGPDGDFGRQERQHDLIKAIMRQVETADFSTVATALWTSLAGHFRTDLTVQDMIGLVDDYRGTCTGETLEADHLNGTTATFTDPIFGVDLSYVIVDPQEVEAKVAALTRPAE
jgi:polyisoprenyl-teichoic acid--peptidoglycan teichoic acid transferase